MQKTTMSLVGIFTGSIALATGCCSSDGKVCTASQIAPPAAPATPVAVTAPSVPAAHADGLSKAGFIVMEEDGRLWVQKPGQTKSDKHITLIGAGPMAMTVKAPDTDTALLYLAAKPGFEVEIDDGRIWAQKPGQEKSDKHATLIGVGPLGRTVKAPDRETALLYLASKPGFEVEVDEGRLWVQKPGQVKSDKHVTLIGAGPNKTTVKAPDLDTARLYLASKTGFEVNIEDGRLWVQKPGQKKSDKHVTKIGVGPGRTTVKAPDMETLNAYLAADV